MKSGNKWLMSLGLLLAVAGPASAGQPAAGAAWPPPPIAEPWPVGALAPDNLAKFNAVRMPFNMTGTWMPVNDPATGGLSRFLPNPKLKPPAQAHFDAGVKANAAGETYMDDVGACWPMGMPKFLNRAWPIQMHHHSTMLLMIQELTNQLRFIYSDGRPHGDPDLVPATWNGDSIARWEGDTFVVDTVNIEPRRHWIETGIPVSDQFHIVERYRMQPDGILALTLTMTDPVMWEGEWVNEKRYRRLTDRDITEVHCFPDLNEHIAGAPRPAAGR